MSATIQTKPKLPSFISLLLVVVLGIIAAKLKWLIITPKQQSTGQVQAVENVTIQSKEKINYGKLIANQHLFGVVEVKKAPVIEAISWDKYGSVQFTIFLFILYALLVPVQELVARAVIQSSLMKIFSGRWMLLKAILLSNLMFSAFHLYLEMTFAIMTFIPGIFWGYLFAKQKGLLGVSISHIIIGLFVLIFLSIH